MLIRSANGASMAIGRPRSNDWLNHRIIDDPSHADLTLAGAHPFTAKTPESPKARTLPGYATPRLMERE
jgi:hypothetical protein